MENKELARGVEMIADIIGKWALDGITVNPPPQRTLVAMAQTLFLAADKLKEKHNEL